jgi:polyisoprenoid-binding protein YceI
VHAEAAEAGERLIVFVQPGVSEVSRHFDGEVQPGVEALAEEMGIAVQVFDVTEAGGAPRPVGITPLLVYQNHRGRSIYQGRYTTLDRVRNFLRTARHVHQGSAALELDLLPVWDQGRASVATPLKITDLEGEVPAGFDAERFRQDAAAAILEADPRFRPDAEMRLARKVRLGRSDRLFYSDFYPYLGKDGRLYLNLALFSQFHCHEPVFVSEQPIAGPWEKRNELFAEGFRVLADEVARQVRSTQYGDGFDPVPGPLPSGVTWADFGLPLPPAPAGATAEMPDDLELVQSWVMDEDVQASRPAVQFTFPAPLDMYTGEAQSVSGDLTLGDGLSLGAMRGRFVADPASVTMGESDLDAAIHGTMLLVEEYPTSDFVIERVETDFDRPEFGQVAAAVLHGRFTMKGQSIPLTVPVSVEAFLGHDGRPRVSIDGTWRLRLLEPFGIEGAPGDPPTNDTLIFQCHLVFKPVPENDHGE